MTEITKSNSSLKNKNASKDISREEIDATLNKIFDNVDKAIKANESRKLTLEDIDRTLYALFDTVNKVHSEGKNVKLPDFKKILESAKS